MCTINPLINCYTGSEYSRVHSYYFGQTFDPCLEQLDEQLENVQSRGWGPFFGGTEPSYADYHVYHMLSNCLVAEPDCVEPMRLQRWMATMEQLPQLAEYLRDRPELVGVGTNPGLLDRNGTLVTQHDPRGHCMLEDGLFVFHDLNAR